jgi:hypothetical protein
MSLTPSLVSVELDSFIKDQESFYWFAKLDDGTIVYEDDNRPGLEEKNAWRRLKTYCELNNRQVVQVGFRFHSNEVLIDTSDWDGVFFIKSVLGFIRVNKSDKPKPPRRFPSRHFYTLGRLGDKIIATKWEMPLCMERNTEEREIGETERLMTIYGKVQVEQ